MSSEVALVEQYDLMDKMARIWLKGERNPTTIAKELRVTRKEVLGLIEEFKEIARNDDTVRHRAKEALHEADESLNLIVKRSWETVEQADEAGDLKTKATVLKNIADVENKRVEMLQKAGLYDDAALGDELAEMEEKQQVLISILKEVTADCAHCKIEVARRLSKVTGKAEPMVMATVIEGEVVDPAT
jgi:myosin heavy subunit